MIRVEVTFVRWLAIATMAIVAYFLRMNGHAASAQRRRDTPRIKMNPRRPATGTWPDA